MKVVVRVRPTCDQEAGSSVALQVVDQIAVLVFDPKSSHIEAVNEDPTSLRANVIYLTCMTSHPLRRRCLKAPQKVGCHMHAFTAVWSDVSAESRVW